MKTRWKRLYKGPIYSDIPIHYDGMIKLNEIDTFDKDLIESAYLLTQTSDPTKDNVFLKEIL